MDFWIIESRVIVNRMYNSATGAQSRFYFRSQSVKFQQFPFALDLREFSVDFLKGCSSEGYIPTVPEHRTLHEDLIRR